MNPDTNEFEELMRESQAVKELIDVEKDGGPRYTNDEAKLRGLKEELEGRLVRLDGSPVPEHWSVFQVGEHIVIKNYTFKVAYIGKDSILFEPVGPVIVGEDKTG